MRWVCMLGTAALLSGCGDKAEPTGQVVATVAGDEITSAELNGALPGNLPRNPKAAARMRSSVLEQLVAQRVVIQEAKRQNLDKSQAYLLAMRRAEGEILTDLLTRRVLQNIKTPDDAAIDAYIAQNSPRFADRVIFQTEQVRAPANGVDPASLKEAHSLDAVVARLRVPETLVERRRSAIDSARLPAKTTRQLLALPPGEPFVVREGGLLLASTIQSIQKDPLTGDKAREAAIALMKQEAGARAVQRQYELLRKGVAVEYQTGFAPASSPSGTPSVTPTAVSAAAK